MRKGTECLPSRLRWFSAETNSESNKLRTKELTQLDARCHLPVIYFNHPNPKLRLWEETKDHINSTGPYKITVLWVYRIDTSSSEVRSTQWVVQTPYCPLASHLSVSSRDSVPAVNSAGQPAPEGLACHPLLPGSLAGLHHGV